MTEIVHKNYNGLSRHDNEGYLHALVSTFSEKDSHGDIIMPGAFKESIHRCKKNKKFPPGLYQHDVKLPVAKTVDAWEDDVGLHVIAKFNLDTQRGRDTFSDIKAGILTEYSIGFRIIDFKNKGNSREIYQVDWMEWSPVFMGANRNTETISIKDGFSIEASQQKNKIFKYRCLLQAYKSRNEIYRLS